MINEQTTYQPKSRITSVKAFAVLATLSVCFLICLGLVARHFPFNQTTSMPFGIYRVVSRPVARGEIVGGCVSDVFAALGLERGYLHSGICRVGIRPVMKYVAAVPGDSVAIRWTGVSVNGIPIPETKLLRTDSLGRELPNQLGTHPVRPGEYWLISNYDVGSFDSRYFGPVTEIVDVVEPILTEKELSHYRFISYLLRLGAILL
jgi:conjugative transfer signal peptidase TraF